jgi:hypothetical protein
VAQRSRRGELKEGPWTEWALKSLNYKTVGISLYNTECPIRRHHFGTPSSGFYENLNRQFSLQNTPYFRQVISHNVLPTIPGRNQSESPVLLADGGPTG